MPVLSYFRAAIGAMMARKRRIKSEVASSKPAMGSPLLILTMSAGDGMTKMTGSSAVMHTGVTTTRKILIKVGIVI
jgi:hypothetical protein